MTDDYTYDELKDLDHDTLVQYAYALQVNDRFREGLFAVLPECPVHGSQCIPYAIEWIEAAKPLMADFRPSGPIIGRAEAVEMLRESLSAEKYAEIAAAVDALADLD